MPRIVGLERRQAVHTGGTAIQAELSLGSGDTQR
jgi:hypothetical protein